MAAAMRKPYAAPAVATRAKCLVAECDRPEELANGRSAGGLCAGHRYRKKRGLPLDVPIDDRFSRRLTPRQALFYAALRVADVGEEDGQFKKAMDALVYAALRIPRREKPR